MSTRRAFPPTATRADIFMYIVRVFVLSVAKGFALGMNNHERALNEASEELRAHGIAPIHLVNVSNALVALLRVANAEYDKITRNDDCPN